jgi:hypothetical protein
MTTDSAPHDSLRDWLADWLRSHYPDAGSIEPEVARRASLNDLPTRFIPALGGLLGRWWTPTFSRVAKSLGYGFVEREVVEVSEPEPTTGLMDIPKDASRRVRRQMMMGQLAIWSWDDLALWCIQNFRRIVLDREAIRQGIVDWAEAHPSTPVDIDAAMEEFERRAAA